MDEPKKYIRTFAGDIEAIKKGVVPNLSPLKTYAGDFSDRMKETKASTATVLAAEQDARTGAPESPAPTTKSNFLYVIAGAVLLILGTVGAYIAYTRYLMGVEQIILVPAASAPIFVDEKEKISGTSPNDLLSAIGQSLARPLAPNTVRFLYTDFATTTDKSVFSALQLPAPGALLRNINAARSMAGIISAGGNQNVFFVLSVGSYSDTFAGMLSWEPTMARDLSELFPAFVRQPAPVFIPAFRDEVVANHDARVYRDAEGMSVFLYGYWDRSTLVIARDPSAFMEITERLATTRTQP